MTPFIVKIQIKLIRFANFAIDATGPWSVIREEDYHGQNSIVYANSDRWSWIYCLCRLALEAMAKLEGWERRKIKMEIKKWMIF